MGQLRFINDDKDTTKMLGFVNITGVMDVYVEHHTSETENEGGFTLDEGLGVTTQEIGVEWTGKGDGEGYDSDIDDLYVGSEEESDTNSLSFISENDDELIEIRKKKLEKKGMTKSEKVGEGKC